ncbi:hypothetical protein ACLMJK_009691 [Lecanora helva]
MIRLRAKTRRALLQFSVVAVLFLLVLRLQSGNSDHSDSFFCADSLHEPSHSRRRSDPAGSTLNHSNRQIPLLIGSDSTDFEDVANHTSAKDRDRVLILTPLKDAAAHIQQHVKLLSELTYPHQAIDLAFLVGDCKDDTFSLVKEELESLQSQSNVRRFRSAMILQNDFGDSLGQGIDERHGFRAQASRRKGLGRARNYLLYNALRPVHDWVYWRDVDIVENPSTILEDFMKHDKDVLVPNIWFHRYDKNGKDIEGRYDYNSWQESWWGRWRRSHLDKDIVLAEGYKEYNMHRRTLNWMGDRHKDKDIEVHLDGIGGVSVLVKADVHRYGINFPCYAFENQADTEGFALMANRAGFQVVGLPNYIVWHIDTEEKEGNLKGNRKKQETR